MRILGISPLDKDSTVSFMEDGKVLFACGEERLSRTKLQDGFPYLSVDYGLRRLGWSTESIDVVAYAFLDADGEAAAIRKALQDDRRIDHRAALKKSASALRRALKSQRSALGKAGTPIPGLSESQEFGPRKAAWKRFIYDTCALNAAIDEHMHRRLLKEWESTAVEDHRLRTTQLAEGLQKYGLLDKLVRFNHHRTHAANAFFSSGYDKALVVSFDGYGTGKCGAVYRAEGQQIELLHQFAFPYSLGIFYEFVTSALGFKAGRHEGKIVGLAAYGDPSVLQDVLLSRFSLENGDIVIHGSHNYFLTRMLASHFSMRDVAAVYQSVLEKVVQDTLAFWVERTGLDCVAVSGGVHANVKLNQRIHEIPQVKSVFVYPNMGDGGCATGAAMLAFASRNVSCPPVDTVYHGPDYSDAEIQQALEEEGLQFEKEDNIEQTIGQLLSEDRIIARFNGRMEYGPRALGNRSILYPAKDPEINLWLNHQLGRTEFMPFAPACLKEAATDLFENTQGCEKTAEFMTITFDCKDFMKQSCPAAVHIDGTARPQVVSPETNESFYQIIRSYCDLTGIPAVINTSFNMHEEPIVCSPQDAIRAFLKGRMDYLAIGDFLVPHPELKRIRTEREKAAIA